MTRKLYVLRHGQTANNINHRQSGSSDAPLTPVGIRQAEEAGRSLAAMGVSPSSWFCSDTIRACQTIEAVMRGLAGEILPYRCIHDIREYSFGRFDGVHYDAEPFMTMQEYAGPRSHIAWEEAYVAYGAERCEDVGRRVLWGLRQAMAATEGDVLAVSHARAMLYLLAVMRGRYVDERPHLSNCDVIELEWRDSEPADKDDVRGTLSFARFIHPTASRPTLI